MNLNYEMGCNPVNVAFLTGVGFKRQREIVHHYALNDRRILPPTGIPLGNIQRGFQANLEHYPNELAALTFPYDYAATAAYAPYDTWGDAYNLTTEFVVPQQARSLAVAAYLMAQTSLKDQAWRTAPARLVFSRETVQMGESLTASLEVEGLDMTGAQIVWEARNEEPRVAETLTLSPLLVGRYWVEAEAMLSDGRRIAAAGEITSTAVAPQIVLVTPQEVRISGTVGQSYIIEASSDLLNWTMVASGTFTSETVDWLDEEAVGAFSRFYRVVAGL
jgi:hypothetical protein